MAVREAGGLAVGVRFPAARLSENEGGTEHSSANVGSTEANRPNVQTKNFSD